MSLSAAVVAELVRAGLSGEALIEACARIDAATPAPVDQAAANKRAYDREYRRQQRERKAESRTTSYESHDIDDSKRGFDVPPDEKNSNPPLIPQKLVVVEARADEIVEVFDEWNRTAKQAGMRTASKLTSERRSRARARLVEHGREAFTEAIRRAGASAFCRGENDRGWKADFDFIVKPQSFLGLIEGKYDDRTPRSSNNRPGSGKRTLADWVAEQREERAAGMG